MSPERRNPCTHTVMTRLFDPYGSSKCSLCHKHPNIGWLYRCTEDSAGFLPESDFTNEPSLLQKKSLMPDVATYCLSTPIVEAIGKGLYTDDQVKKLIEQKGRVRDHVLGQQQPETRPTTASTSTSSSSSIDGSFSTLPQSTTFSTNSSISLDEEIKAAYDWKELQKVWMSEPTLPPPDCRPKALAPRDLSCPTLKAVQPCTFRICPTCRPTYCDRAYQSLDYILNNPIQIPPIWELENRRVSDAKTVARIGTRKPFRFYEHASPAALQSLHSIPGLGNDRSDEDEDFYDASSEPERDESEGNEHIVDTHSIRRRSGFRQTVRKALARARSDDSTSNASNIDESESSDSRLSRSLTFRRRWSRRALSFVEAHGRVVDTSTLHDSVMLMLATNTPLPHTPTLDHWSSDQSNDSMSFTTADILTQA